jgi:hypothetical protein
MKVLAIDRQLQDCDAFLAGIREWLLQAHALMKITQDKCHSQVEFTIGD